MAVRETKKEKISILLEDLASLESYARDLFGFFPNPVLLVSSSGIILEANPAFEKITGHKTEEIVGRPIEDFFEKEKMATLVEKSLSKGHIGGEEINLFDKNKNALPVSVSTMLRKNESGEVVGFFLGLFDLTNSKKAEENLRNAQAALTNILEDAEEARARAEEEKNKTRAIILNFTDGILVFNEKNRLALINPSAERLLNIKAKNIMNGSISELNNFSGLEPLTKALGTKFEEIFRKEISIKNDLILELSTVPVMVNKDKRLGTLVILHDVSRDKIIERMKSEFVSLAAHQLRTPLSAIKWTMKMLMEGDLGPISKEQREFIEKTYHSNERMIGLINDLLDLTRIEEGRYLYKPALSNFELMVEYVVNSYKEEAAKKKIKLEFKKTEGKLPSVRLDAEKIKLAIQNLIDNAVKYTPSGGLVTISLNYDKDKVELSVQDNGVGIPEDQQKRVFSKFFRGANVMRLDTEGSGLGLFITKNIIEAHGGKIWFESAKDRGSTFHFTLPVKTEFESFLKEF